MILELKMRKLLFVSTGLLTVGLIVFGQTAASQKDISNKPMTVKSDIRQPEITIGAALKLAETYVKEHQINVSEKYIDSIRLDLNPRADRGKHWRVAWELNKFAKGGQVYLDIFMDKSVEIHYGE
jgi:hypothetical protein